MSSDRFLRTSPEALMRLSALVACSAFTRFLSLQTRMNVSYSQPPKPDTGIPMVGWLIVGDREAVPMRHPNPTSHSSLEFPLRASSYHKQFYALAQIGTCRINITAIACKCNWSNQMSQCFRWILAGLPT
jgi:hypothetical protein